MDKKVDREVDREVTTKVDKETHPVKGVRDMGSWYNLELLQCYLQALVIPNPLEIDLSEMELLA